MRSNLLSITKMQLSALSQIVWLQLLSIALFPMFFNQINRNNDFANIIICASGFLMLSYLLLRNFAFNDARYKTKLLYSILPVTLKTIILARSIIIYLCCLTAAPLLILFSYVTHAIRPAIFAVAEPHILPYALLLASIFLPIEVLIFYMFEAQKADIIGALVTFLYMGIMAVIYNYLLRGPLLMVVIMAAIVINVLCYRLTIRLYVDREQ